MASSWAKASRSSGATTGESSARAFADKAHFHRVLGGGGIRLGAIGAGNGGTGASGLVGEIEIGDVQDLRRTAGQRSMLVEIAIRN